MPRVASAASVSRGAAEDGVRLGRILLEREAQVRRPQPLRTHTVGGRGLQPGLSWDDLWTADRDFSRFAGLATRNPLA